MEPKCKYRAQNYLVEIRLIVTYLTEESKVPNW